MPYITDAQIASWVSHILWPMFRITAFFLIVPIFGSRLIPQRIRVLLGGAITIVVAPMLPEMPDLEGTGVETMIVIAHQLIIGFTLGFLVMILFQVFVMAGQIIAMQMGLGYASMMDPSNGVTVTVLSQWYLTLITLIFVAINGHLVILEILIESFYTLPVGLEGLSPDSIYQVIHWGNWFFSSSVSIALPAIASLLLVNLSFGIISRTAPSMNVFALGFPMTMLMGLFVLWVSYTSVLPTIQRYFVEQVATMKMVVGIP